MAIPQGVDLKNVIGCTGYWDEEEGAYLCIVCNKPLLYENNYTCNSKLCAHYKDIYRSTILSNEVEGGFYEGKW